MSYRDDVDALTARQTALANEVDAKRRELDETSQMLDEARARAKLPILDNIRVASPCRADWNAMTGDDRARHCADCDKDVFNLSGMTRDEAEALIVAKAGNLCVRYYQRSDGTILLADCTIGVKRKRRRRLVAAGAAAMLAGGGAIGWRLSREEESIEKIDDDTRIEMGSGEHEMGVVAVPPRVIEKAKEQDEWVVMGQMPVSPPAVKPAKKPVPKKSSR